MEFSPSLQPARLIRRYKRFLADVEWPDGSCCTVHCPNTGAMTGCAEPGSKVWLSRASNPKRKYAWTWELVETADQVTVGIHTGRTNRLAEQAILQGRFDLLDCAELRREVCFGDSRLDFVLTGSDGIETLVEVKNVTAAVTGGIAEFPDAVSTRATRHVDHLAQAMAGAHSDSQDPGQDGDKNHKPVPRRAALIFVVQRGDVEAVRPAASIDPAFATAVAGAARAGVHILAARWSLTPQQILFDRHLPVINLGS